MPHPLAPAPAAVRPLDYARQRCVGKREVRVGVRTEIASQGAGSAAERLQPSAMASRPFPPSSNPERIMQPFK